MAPAIVDERIAGAGIGRRALIAIATGVDRILADPIKGHGIDVMFESAQWFGNRFPAPVVSWIPDFQHRRLPHLFPLKVWWRRDLGYRLQTSGNRVIMLSSNDALADCEKFYPASRGKTGVVRFAIDLDPGPHLDRASAVRASHGLPKRFFYLPNQFWSHKNHKVVVEALKHLRQSGNLAVIPPVILTGRTEDPRDPTLYTRLMAEVSAQGLESHFRHLGLIPYEDVFALNAAADHLLNPSQFEGWSTTVERSEVAWHADGAVRHSDPPGTGSRNADFFRPDDAKALADILRTIASQPPRPRECIDTLRAEQQKRRNDYAAALLAVFEKAITQTRSA